MQKITRFGKLSISLISIILALSSCQSQSKEKSTKANSTADLGTEIADSSKEIISDSLMVSLYSQRAQLYTLGRYYQKNDQPEQALGIYKRMISLDSTDKIAYYNSGYVKLVFLKKFKEVAEYFSRAIQLDPAYADAFFYRGYCYELMGDASKARTDYEKVLKITPNDAKAINGLSRLNKLIP